MYKRQQVSVNNQRCADNNAAISELKVEKLTELETKIDSKADETHLKLQQIQQISEQIHKQHMELRNEVIAQLNQ